MLTLPCILTFSINELWKIALIVKFNKWALLSSFYKAETWAYRLNTLLRVTQLIIQGGR